MVTVGIDPHKKTHTAIAVEVSGRQLGKPLTVADEPQAVAKLLAWAGQLASGEPVRWAIEDGRGLARRLATGLVMAGQQVVWVPVRLMAGERAHTGPRGKSDPLDALAVAKAARNPDNHGFLAPHRADEPGRALAWLVGERRDRLVERTRVINSLRWQLHELGPGLEPACLTGKKAPHQLATRLGKLPESLLRDLAINACYDLARLTERITGLAHQIDQATAQACPTLRARCGVGPIVAGTIIAELGDPTRICSGAALARMAGTAPSRSGPATTTATASTAAATDASTTPSTPSPSPRPATTTQPRASSPNTNKTRENEAHYESSNATSPMPSGATSKPTSPP